MTEATRTAWYCSSGAGVRHIWHDGQTWHYVSTDAAVIGRPAIVALDDGSVWFLARDSTGWVVAGEVVGATTGETRRVAPASSGWEVAIDSRSHDLEGIVRMLMPVDDDPQVVTFAP